jgi:hypothetical protein
LDFQRRELTVRDGKGGKVRLTLLPQSLLGDLQEHVRKVRRLHQNGGQSGELLAELFVLLFLPL